MTQVGKDTLGTRSTMTVDGKEYAYYSFAKAAEKIGDVSKLPFSMKVLLENLLRDFPSGTEEQKALYARDRLLPAMNELRQAADALEQMCPAHLWPMPTYGELLYGV